MKLKLVFVSSPQKEFSRMRKGLWELVHSDPYLSEYFKVFIFENLPANERTPQDIYLDEVRKCSVYLGVFGRTYGTQDSSGISATEHEFDLATALGKSRLIFLRNLSRKTKQSKKMAALVKKTHVVKYERFRSDEELKRKVMQSLLFWQQNQAKREESADE